MDRGRTFARFLIAGALLVLAAADRPSLPIREAEWIAPDARLQMLSQRRGVCIALPARPEELRLVATGMAAFRAPLLLGGQAARAGLSCNSCHVGGGANPHFRFPGLSGADGTADVTSSIMSSHRRDRIHNPKPIPDLASDPPKVSRELGNDALRTFIHGLIVDEFDGPEPSVGTLDGLVAYVRALGGKGCRRGPDERPTAAAGITEAIGSVWLAGLAMDRKDAGTARLMIASARTSLGPVHERFAGPDLASERRLIEGLDAQLRTIREEVAADPAKSRRAMLNWTEAATRTAEKLRSREALSLYNPERLEAALGRAR